MVKADAGGQESHRTGRSGNRQAVQDAAGAPERSLPVCLSAFGTASAAPDNTCGKSHSRTDGFQERNPAATALDHPWVQREQRGGTKPHPARILPVFWREMPGRSTGSHSSGTAVAGNR